MSRRAIAFGYYGGTDLTTGLRRGIMGGGRGMDTRLTDRELNGQDR